MVGVPTLGTGNEFQPHSEFKYAGIPSASGCAGQECCGQLMAKDSGEQRVVTRSRGGEAGIDSISSSNSLLHLCDCLDWLPLMIVLDMQRVRETVLRLLLVEQSSRIAVQLALLVTNISRFDFPPHWPNLLSELAGACMPDSPVPIPGRERAMLALKHVLRALRSKRIVVETPRPNSGQMSPQGWGFLSMTMSRHRPHHPFCLANHSRQSMLLTQLVTLMGPH